MADDSCSWRQILCTQLPPICSMTPWAPWLHRPSPEREHERGWGSATSPTPHCRASSAWELGAAVLGSRSVIKHSSGGTVMAAGSSPALPVPGTTWVGRGHQRTVSTQQPLARKLPGCPTPSASNCRYSNCPDIALAAMGWMGPPLLPPPSCPTPDPADTGHTEVLLWDTKGLRDGRGAFFPSYTHLPSPRSPAVPGVLEELTPLPSGLPLLWARL